MIILGFLEALSLDVVVSGVWLGVSSLLASLLSEVFQGLSASASSQKDGVGSGGGSFCELIESQDFSSSLDNSVTCTVAAFQAADAQFGNSQESLIIQDVSNQNEGSLSFVLSVGSLNKS